MRFKQYLVSVLIIIVALTYGYSQEAAKEETNIESYIEEHLQDVPYGSHQRNVLDLWIVKSNSPSPLVLFIHGGGFRKGDKSKLDKKDLVAYLKAGYSVASINYRLTDTAPAPAAYLDCGRAIQFLRFNAEKYNIDPELVASTGGSAGAGTSMWLGFHDDLANPDSDDPISRQSTRLTCLAVSNGQSSYDPRFAEKIGIPRPNFDQHIFFLPFYGITADEIDSPKAYELYTKFAPITYVSSDDPPILLEYNFPNVEVDENTGLNTIVHHPKFGIALKQELDKLGIECIVQHLNEFKGTMMRYEAEPGKMPVNKVDFIKKHFDAARK